MLNIQEAGQNEEIMSSINDSLFILLIGPKKIYFQANIIIFFTGTEFVSASHLVCHRLISSWKTDLNSSLAALELLQGLARTKLLEKGKIKVIKKEVGTPAFFHFWTLVENFFSSLNQV